MVKIDESRRPPLDELAMMWFTTRSGRPSLEFYRHVAGIAEPDIVVARRLGVGISTVREWRAMGQRPS